MVFAVFAVFVAFVVCVERYACACVDEHSWSMSSQTTVR